MGDSASLSLDIFEKNFVNRGWEFGNKAISNAVVAWAKGIAVSEERLNETFDFRFLSRGSENHSKVTQQRVGDLIVYQGESLHQHIWRGLTHEWVHRYWILFNSMTQEGFKRYRKLVRETDPDLYQAAIARAQEAILLDLASLSVDEGLDYLASITVFWACRFTEADFLTNLEDAGHDIPADVDLDHYIAQFCLWSLADYFQLGHL